MKKMVVALLVATIAVGGAFAVDLSAGIGGNFSAYFTSLSATSDGEDYLKIIGAESKDLGITTTGGGVYAFFDITYVELNVGLMFSTTKANNNDYDMILGAEDGMSMTHLRLGLFGKFPIDLDSFTLFPMLGIDFLINLAAKDVKSGDKIEDKDLGIYSRGDLFNQFWFKLGVGADIPLGDSMYLRPTFLYGIRLNNQGEKDLIKDWNSGPTDMVKSIVGHGLDVKLALGFKF
ncbi:MAG: hypothetical protein FWD36_07420 [Treponema sp.]|nr:hypothetical protein [Treponema sp.]